MKYKTEQENFWSGEFGDKYIERNDGKKILASNIALFSQILENTTKVRSVIEFGANIGLNLKAIKQLIPNVECSAVEINHKAAEILKAEQDFLDDSCVFEESILNFEAKCKYDFVLIKGVLIHINPNELESVYQKLYETSEKYICIAEYYNPSPVSINYRGNEDRLFKRDFAGEFMDRYPDVSLVDYGFKWHRDNNFAQDDITWFLLRKE